MYLIMCKGETFKTKRTPEKLAEECSNSHGGCPMCRFKRTSRPLRSEVLCPFRLGKYCTTVTAKDWLRHMKLV